MKIQLHKDTIYIITTRPVFYSTKWLKIEIFYTWFLKQHLFRIFYVIYLNTFGKQNTFFKSIILSDVSLFFLKIKCMYVFNLDQENGN